MDEDVVRYHRWKEFGPAPTVPLAVHEKTVKHMLRCIDRNSIVAAVEEGERALGIHTEDQRKKLYNG